MRLADELGLGHQSSRAMQFRGIARCDLGDFGGLDDLKEAVQAAVDHAWTRAAGVGFNNYGSWVWMMSGADEALPVYREGIEFSQRRGAGRVGMWTLAESTWPFFDAGLWDELLEAVRTIEEDAQQQGSGQSLLIGLTCKARVLFYRGDVDGAAAISADVLPRAREVGDAQFSCPRFRWRRSLRRTRMRRCALVEEALATGYALYPDTARVAFRTASSRLRKGWRTSTLGRRCESSTSLRRCTRCSPRHAASTGSRALVRRSCAPVDRAPVRARARVRPARRRANDGRRVGRTRGRDQLPFARGERTRE